MERKNTLPLGVRDYLPAECSRKRALEGKIIELFVACGYSPVETPVIENMDVFAQGLGAFSQESMFKLTDDKGRLLVLRPDITMPVARVAATRMKNEDVLRLCYCGDVFSFCAAPPAGLKQITQMGVELMGKRDDDADVEVIELAIDTLRQCGLRSFLVDIGQVEFFNGLVQDAGLSGEEFGQISALVEQKDMFALEMLLQRVGVGGKLKNNIMQLPMLYGGIEVLDEAISYSANQKCRDAIENLKAIAGKLSTKGMERYISIDLGLLQSVHYYTGIVFKGISDKSGYPIITGGRYDNLVSQYGRDMAATGFALKLDQLMTALDGEGSPGEEAVC